MATNLLFNYESLDADDNKAFRLLTILPGKYKDKIYGTTQNVSLNIEATLSDGIPITAKASFAPLNGKTASTTHKSHKPWKSWFRNKKKKQVTEIGYIKYYECLSYAWGDEPARKQIILNKKPFNLSPTLESAIRSLRHEKTARVIWIDAICIDQNNDDEKPRQIRFMQEIYSNADQVVVWLGTTTHDSDLAFSFAQEITNAVSPNGRMVTSWRKLSPAVLQKHHLLDDSRIPAWAALHAVIGRNWWRRGWCVQEVELAKSVSFVCGRNVLPGTVLGQAVIAARTTHPYFSNSHPRILSSSSNCQGATYICERFAKDWDKSLPKYDTIMWMKDSRRRLCSLPHDKIYSILGLTSEQFRNAISIDYTQPVNTLYRAVVIASIEETNSLNILSHAHHAAWYPDSPSWIPDWRLNPRLQIFKFARNSKDWPPQATFSDNLTDMTVKGQEIARITESNVESRLIRHFARTRRLPYKDDRSAQTSWNISPQVWGELFASITDDWDTYRPKVHGRSSRLSILLKTLSLTWKPELTEPTPAPTPTPTAQQAEAEGEASKSQHADDADIIAFLSEWQQLTRCRTVVATDGFLALAPDCAEQGDVIYVISGLYSPVVLRPCGEGRFRLIGDVYLSNEKGDGEMYRRFSSDLFPDLKDITLA